MEKGLISGSQKTFASTERSSASSSPEALELALAHRQLWRLPLEMQGELPSARRQDPSRGPSQSGALQTANGANAHSKGPARMDMRIRRSVPGTVVNDDAGGARSVVELLRHRPMFPAPSNLDPTLLDRVGAYEARLWRQAAQTIWTVEAMRRPLPPMRNDCAIGSRPSPGIGRGRSWVDP